jgi:hypothetical protein
MPYATGAAHWSRNLSVNLSEVNESLVKVFDGLGSIFRRFVADIANATMRKELDVGDGELGKVLAHVVLGKSWG